ncbi:MAG: hypothetical protein ICV83_24940 [Cytophagales bacterium]|nr:hypothetical protein [Cytophagales bacterium]
MKKFLYLPLVALLLASCAQEVKEPAAKTPAPPPPILISNVVGNGTPSITSSLSGARIVVDSPSETGVVVYYNDYGCARARFEAMTFGSPMIVQISAHNCAQTNSYVFQPPFTWQTYDVGDLRLPGGGLTIMVQANSSGHYGGGEIRNLVWY